VWSLHDPPRDQRRSEWLMNVAADSGKCASFGWIHMIGAYFFQACTERAEANVGLRSN